MLLLLVAHPHALTIDHVTFEPTVGSFGAVATLRRGVADALGRMTQEQRDLTVTLLTILDREND